jgi:hypothetical protein
VDFDRVTVQVVLAFEARLAEAHCREETVTGATSEIVAGTEAPLNVAVTVAVWSAVKVFAVAGKVPLLVPAGIVREAGTVRLVELEFRPMLPPPVPLRFTVQVLVALGANVPGLHTRELSTVAALTVPPVPATLMESPASEAPRLLLILTGTSALPDRVTDRVATIPLATELVFIPDAIQV